MVKSCKDLAKQYVDFQKLKEAKKNVVIIWNPFFLTKEASRPEKVAK